MPEAFQYAATASGRVTELWVYLDRSATPGRVDLGLYASSSNNQPTSLLTSGEIARPIPGAWNAVVVPEVTVSRGQKYWIAIVAPVESGDVAFRDRVSGRKGEVEAATANLRILPDRWAGRQPSTTSSLSADVVQVSGGGPVISPVDVSSVTDNGAAITWTTDRPATSQIDYGPTTALGNRSTLDRALTVEHRQVLAGLTADSTVNVRVVSTDPNQSTSSDNLTLRTGPARALAASVGEWSPLMQWPLVAVHMSLLNTGEVLMWDAWEFNGTPSARVWNPSSETFVSDPLTLSQVFCAAQTMLPDGRVLVTGGHNGADTGIKKTVIFDPATDKWTPLPRAALDVDEYPSTFLLPNGKLFVANGIDGKSRTLDLQTQTWTTYGADPAPTGTAVMYRPGKVLTTGGGTNNADPVQSTAATIDLNQKHPTWQRTTTMIYPRYKHNLVVLPDGKVLAVGGSTIYSLVSTTGVLPAEIWDPDARTWNRLASAHDLRMYHATALLLPDGRVLVAGGGRLNPAVDYLTAEIYSPPYLFRGPRPTITDAPATTTYGSSMTVQTPDTAGIAHVAFMRLGSVTHAFDDDQRYLDLRFTTSAGKLTVTSPATANLAPPGYYMLFVVNGRGVPSVAKIVQMTGGPRTVVGRPTP